MGHPGRRVGEGRRVFGGLSGASRGGAGAPCLCSVVCTYGSRNQKALCYLDLIFCCIRRPFNSVLNTASLIDLKERKKCDVSSA